MKYLRRTKKSVEKCIGIYENELAKYDRTIENSENFDEVEKAKNYIIKLNKSLEQSKEKLILLEQEIEKMENDKPIKSRKEIRAEREIFRKCLQGIEDMYKEGKFSEQTYLNEKLEHLGYLNALDFVLKE